MKPLSLNQVAVNVVVAFVLFNYVSAIFFHHDDHHKKAIHIVKKIPYPVHIVNKIPIKVSGFTLSQTKVKFA